MVKRRKDGKARVKMKPLLLFFLSKKIKNSRKAAEVYAHACKIWRVIFPIRLRIGLSVIYRIFHPNKKVFGGIEFMDPVLFFFSKYKGVSSTGSTLNLVWEK